MKVLLLVSLISSMPAFSKYGCKIELFKKTASAKTAYTRSGESISASVIKKLSKDCTFSTKLMSLAQKRDMDIKRLRARLKKLGAK